MGWLNDCATRVRDHGIFRGLLRMLKTYIQESIAIIMFQETIVTLSEDTYINTPLLGAFQVDHLG